MPPSAIVSVPVPRLPMIHPGTVDPGGARARHPHRTQRARTLADVGGEGGVIVDRPTVCDRKRTRAKTADIEPARKLTGVLFQVEPGPVTVTAPRAEQSDRAAATAVHYAAVLDGKRAGA